MSRRSCAVCQLKDTWNMSRFEGYVKLLKNIITITIFYRLQLNFYRLVSNFTNYPNNFGGYVPPHTPGRYGTGYDMTQYFVYVYVAG